MRHSGEPLLRLGARWSLRPRQGRTRQLQRQETPLTLPRYSHPWVRFLSLLSIVFISSNSNIHCHGTLIISYKFSRHPHHHLQSALPAGIHHLYDRGRRRAKASDDIDVSVQFICDDRPRQTTGRHTLGLV